MQSNAITKAAFVAIGLLVALLTMMRILTEGWNALGNLYKYMLVLALLVGLLVPKIGLGILALGAFYIDTFKRLLVVAGNVTYLDISYILAFAPFLVLAIFCSSLYQVFVQGSSNRPGALKLACFVIVVMGVFSVFSLVTHGFGLGGMQMVANGAAFIALIFIVPVQYGTREELLRAARVVIWLAVPVAAYGIYQWAFGLSKFEIAYLETGLSTESRILMGEDFRVFSTLNSSQNFAKVMGMIAVMMMFALRPGQINRLVWRLPVAGIFFFAAVVSGSRTGIVMAFIALAALVIYRWKGLTIVFYSVCVVSLLLIIVNAQSLYQRNALRDLEQGLSDVAASTGVLEYRNIQIVTLNARLRSLALLTDPDYWTPFGVGFAKREDLLTNVKIHDIITSFLVRMGYVPCGLGLIMLIYALAKIHSAHWKMEQRSMDFRIVLFSLAFSISVLIGGVSATANLYTFPVNYFFYLFIGFGVAVAMMRRREASLAADEAERQESTEAPAPFSGSRPLPA